MSSQFVLSVSDSAQGGTLGDLFRWCWLGADGLPLAAPVSGDRDSLRAHLAERASGTQSTWLILPGERVGTRELEYSDKEKKHLRSLMPFQLEDEVIGDVEEMHFALSPAANGKVTLAFTDKAWLQAVFAELAALGMEVTHCWSSPLTLPLPAEASGEAWVLGLNQGRVSLRYNQYQGFELLPERAPLALQLLINARQLDTLPSLYLRAASQAELDSLQQLLPEALRNSVVDVQLLDSWLPDTGNTSIDLCQGEFSQRLPLDRWWKQWKALSIFAGVCLLVYLCTLGFEIFKLNKQNLQTRQQIEASARQVIQGKIVSSGVEKQLSGMLAQLNPQGGSGGSKVMELLAVALPQIASMANVQVKGIAFSGETGELNINIQADSFSAFQALSDKIKAQGLNAELLSANVQGSVQSARLKITKP